MANLVVTENADADLEEILSYLEREAGPRVAESYGRKIGESLTNLVAFPGIGSAARRSAPTPGSASSGPTS